MKTLGPEELSLLLGFAVWVALGAWTALRGWTVQRRHLVGSGLEPLGRWTLTWWVLLLGATVLVLTHRWLFAPGVVAVAMAGLPAAVVDARTRRLPDTYTLVMALGALLGVGCVLFAPDRGRIEVLEDVALGVVVWTLPLLVARLTGGAVGLGDLKLVPVLGALTGLAGWETAVAGLVMAFLGAGAHALALVVTGAGGMRTRIPMGPWLIGGALLVLVAEGFLPPGG